VQAKGATRNTRANVGTHIASTDSPGLGTRRIPALAEQALQSREALRERRGVWDLAVRRQLVDQSG
jgi:hypothetical protein